MGILNIQPHYKKEDTKEAYWKNDIWNIENSIFLPYKNIDEKIKIKTINFSIFKKNIKNEVKLFMAHLIFDRYSGVTTVFNYGDKFDSIVYFLENYLNEPNTLIGLDENKVLKIWEKNKYKFENTFITFLVNLIKYINIKLVNKDCFQNDIWDFRELFPNKILPSKASYSISFSKIESLPFRNLAKRYVKALIARKSMSQCRIEIRALTIFFNFIKIAYPTWENINQLTRAEMEEFLSWYHHKTIHYKSTHITYLHEIKKFLEYIQLAEYEEAPKIESYKLIFQEDFPRKKIKTEDSIKYIPEDVIEQFDKNIFNITPKKYIPIILLLRVSGWRISDVLNLKYNTCLEKHNDGYYLCGDISKTLLENHKIPIDKYVADIVKNEIKHIEKISSKQNNPKKFLFLNTKGKRIGYPTTALNVSGRINALSKKYNIKDINGEIFKFKNHAFRHTKGVELINNGMNILHIQKWLGHSSPTMTQHYAKISDNTLRKSWEETIEKGLFQIDTNGGISEIISIQDEDIIEWEWIKHNLDAVRMPLGYCMKPNKMECATQLNPCLTCSSLCTTPDFITSFENEIKETKNIIDKGNIQGRTIWVEKNQIMLKKLENILAVLKTGKIKHDIGKRGREYTNNAKGIEK